MGLIGIFLLLEMTITQVGSLDPVDGFEKILPNGTGEYIGLSLHPLLGIAGGLGAFYDED